MVIKRAAAIAGLTALACAAAVAQTPTPARREFEVASIRKNDSDRPQVYMTPFAFLPGGRFTASNVTLTDVIVMAYKTRRIQMWGGPTWIDLQRFDIVAKADATAGEVAEEQWKPMV